MIKYNKAPLPFLGQKRNWLKFINNLDFSNKTVIDLFGGSGLIAHTIKYNHPSAKVIWNDFDDYQDRLNKVPVAEALRLELLSIGAGLRKGARIEGNLKKAMITAIDHSGCTDWITLSSWLLFSGNYVHSLNALTKGGWYFRVTNSLLTNHGYLASVERVQCDFMTLINKYKDCDNVIYIADPPYIMTNQAGYVPARDGQYFRLKDAIELIRMLQGKQALLFSSIKSESDDLINVWSPTTLKRIDYKASTGGGNSSIEHLFMLNWPE